MLFTLVLLSAAHAAWAGPAEEVAQLGAPRLKAFHEGNVEAYVAAFADNAVFQSSLTPFRIEGKEAIRNFFAEAFQNYPRRRVTIRQPSARVFGDDLVIQNGYSVLQLTAANGETHTYNTRSSVVWRKTEGRWQIVDQHISRLPGTQ